MLIVLRTSLMKKLERFVRALTSITGNGLATVFVCWREGELAQEKQSWHLISCCDRRQ